eukprot:4849266-Ditylum_brightwellii.AAC.1
MKCKSTIAYQALYPDNVEKRWCYWNLPYPTEIIDCRRSKMTDLDICECGANVDRMADFIQAILNDSGH